MYEFVGGVVQSVTSPEGPGIYIDLVAQRGGSGRRVWLVLEPDPLVTEKIPVSCERRHREEEPLTSLDLNMPQM